MLFVEVTSVEKGCTVMVNMESCVEVCPMKDGTTALFFEDAAAVGGRTAFKVKESYNMFRQFVVQTVAPDDIAARIKNLPKVSFSEEVARIAPEPRLPELEIDEDDGDDEDTPGQVQKRSRGRPRKDAVMGNSTANIAG